jgi:hypothetical protein
VAHFKIFLAENKNEKVGDTLEILALFLRMIDQANNQDLYSEMSMEELSGVLESLKKDKSQAPMDGQLISPRIFLLCGGRPTQSYGRNHNRREVKA